MTKRLPPVDGSSIGSPLSAARAPARDIRDWIYWLGVSKLDLPAGAALHGGMLTDHACLRIITGGTWIAETASGLMKFDPGRDGMALYFGPQSQHVKLTVQGSFRILTMHLRAGASTVLEAPAQTESRDCIYDHHSIVGHGNLASRFDPAASDEDWLVAMEDEMRKFLCLRDTAPPDPVITAFERASLSTPDMSIAGFAEEHGISPRTLERLVMRDYGVTPKTVLRRARALDMAAAILGVVAPDEQSELELRYFDQSHLIKEIRHFFGMTPSELPQRAIPLLRVNLEIRQSRRLEAMGRWTPDEPLPWSK
ncbi:helix-turn-helix domain-containing protein [Altererythrobacter sp. MTPC7]|uniref:helix-turn-helix transcriptional regulator n=1 Tax=Altererythrobacter sp. MTPC7 TaxID=3056567 RepID=UPI0036F29587